MEMIRATIDKIEDMGKWGLVYMTTFEGEKRSMSLWDPDVIIEKGKTYNISYTTKVQGDKTYFNIQKASLVEDQPNEPTRTPTEGNKSINSTARSIEKQLCLKAAAILFEGKGKTAADAGLLIATAETLYNWLQTWESQETKTTKKALPEPTEREMVA